MDESRVVGPSVQCITQKTRRTGLLNSTTRLFFLFHSDVLESHVFAIRDSLQLQFDGTFEDIAENFFCIADQEVHFSWMQILNYNASDHNQVAASFDDDLREKEPVPCAGHEAADKEVLCRSL